METSCSLALINIPGPDHLSGSLGPRGVYILQYFGSFLLRSSLCRFPWSSRSHLDCVRCILRLSRTKKRGYAALFHRPNGMHTRCTGELAAGVSYCNIPPGNCTSRPSHRHRQSKDACACQLERFLCNTRRARATQTPNCRRASDHCCTVYPNSTAVLADEFTHNMDLPLSCSMHAVQQKMNRQLARSANFYTCNVQLSCFLQLTGLLQRKGVPPTQC